MLAIVNDAAQAYRGVIPADRWREPYMPADELEKEIADGVVFWVAEENDAIRKDRKSTRLNSSHRRLSRMPSSA